MFHLLNWEDLLEEQILENVGQELSFGHVQCEDLLGVDMQVDC